MKGMILAAGRGTRAIPLTDKIPKPMLPILGRPVMEYLVRHLCSYEITSLVANTSHHANIIEGYFGNGSQFAASMGFSFEGKIINGELITQAVGSASGMKLIQERTKFFDETFVVVCGDAIIDVDLSKAIEFHKKRGSLATIITRNVPREEVYRYGVVRREENGKILEFQEKPTIEEALSTEINTGIYIFEPGIFKYIPYKENCDIGSQLLPELARSKESFFSYNLDFQWVDIGCLADFYTAQIAAIKGEINGLEIGGKEIMPKVFVEENVWIHPDAKLKGPIFIGSSSIIGKEAKIQGPCIIGRQCEIRNANLQASVCMDYTFADSGAEVKNAIIFEEYLIDNKGEVFSLEKKAPGVRDIRAGQAFFS